MLTTMYQEPKTVENLVSAAFVLALYPGLQNQDIDQDGPQGQIVPRAWRQTGLLDEMQDVQGCGVMMWQTKRENRSECI